MSPHAPLRLALLPVVAAGLLSLLAASRSPDSQAPPPARRVALTLDLLEVAEGSRLLDRRRLVLEVGMEGTLVFTPRNQGLDWGDCRVELRTRSAAGGNIRLSLDAAPEKGEDGCRRQGDLLLADGTSGVLEIGRRSESGPLLLLSASVTAAEGEKISVPPARVQLEIQVSGEQGGESVVLQNPRLRTLSGAPVDFEFDYGVPAPGGGRADRVRFEIRLTPGHPRESRLPLEVEITGAYPSADRPVLVSRSRKALLAAGEPWAHRFETVEGAVLLLTVRALWTSL